MRRLLSIALCAACLATMTTAAQAEAPQPAPQSIQVGHEMTALRDVTVRNATIAKGSRVKVTSVQRQRGRIVSVSLELKDGHVLQNVAIGVIQQNFR